MKKLRRSVFLWGFLFFSFLPALRAQVLYVAAAGDLRDGACADEIRAGLTFFTSLFVENLPAENVSVYNAPDSNWTGDDISAADHPITALKIAIETCPAAADDGILIFWFGRGGLVKDEFFFFVSEPAPEGETPPAEKPENADPDGGDASDAGDAESAESASDPELVTRRIPRSEVILSLKEKKIRFAGLITESSRSFKRGNTEKTPHYTPNTGEITSLMSSLFFETRGFLDLNSSRKNQSSLLIGTYGSLMLESLGEFLETCDYKAARWTDAIDAVNALMRDNFRAHKQKIDVFSVPKEPRDPPPPPGPGPGDWRHHSAQRWRDDWDEIGRSIRERIDRMPDERYPADYQAAPDRFRSRYWSAPVYYPETGDLLIGINGQRILNYRQYLDAIQMSPEMIYLTVIDHRTGFVYEMRTVMGPPGPAIRLGLAVVEDPWGGVRVTNTVLGSPAAHCQYLIGYRHWRYAPFGI
ncbi:MAG: hypothetical protein K6E55_01860 [Thermoguttaceae bacterium]|nr:hypothetical protein [Thermoguttaceae bacterium]